jgi:hypothetical protein
MMEKVKRGFTLVEVALFLAVTGLLFVGVVLGIQNSLFQQKYNDSVQGFAEFLRSIYSQTANTENTFQDDGSARGQSDLAIFGKLVTFGESMNFEGKDNVDKTIFSYTVVGEIDNSFGSGNVLEELKRLNASVFVEENGRVGLAGIAEQYFPMWGASIETTDGWKYKDFVGALLVVRHPRSGTVFTYVLEGETVEVNMALANGMAANPLTAYLSSEGTHSKFSVKDVDFCVDPEGNVKQSLRRNVRIIRGARSASGVELIGQYDDTIDNGVKVGNRCED